MPMTEDETADAWRLFHDVYAEYVSKCSDGTLVDQAYWQGNKDGIRKIIALAGFDESARDLAQALNDSSPGGPVEIRVTRIELLQSQLKRAFDLLFEPDKFRTPPAKTERERLQRWIAETKTLEGVED